MSYIFGKDIERVFYPHAGKEPINLPSQVAEIYLFSSQPTMTEAINGTNAIPSHTVSYWEHNTISPYGRKYTIPAIADPDVDSAIPKRGYWQAINFYAKISAQKQTLLEYFEVRRAEGVPEVPSTSKYDLKNIYPAISSYVTDQQLENFIDIALDQIKLELKNKGVEYQTIDNLKDLKLALAYKTISLVSLSQIKEPTDRFALRYDEFKTMYHQTMKLITLVSDSNSDGTIDTETPANRGAITVFK